VTHAALTYQEPTAKGVVAARLKTRDGATLAFKTFPARRQQKGTVLVLHGMGLNAALYSTLGSMLAAKGLGVALMDFRGHGDSSGKVGDATGPTTYREDLREAVAAFGSDGPLFIFAHSGSAVAAIDLLSQPDAPKIAGLAMVAPTISGDRGLTRSPNRGLDIGLMARNMLRFRPERGMNDAAAEFCPNFNFKKFLLARVTGLGRWMHVLSFVSTRPGDAPFRYTARAALNMISTWSDTNLAKLQCPVCVITAEQDPFVNGEAIATRLPWVLGPQAQLRHEILLRGDHFTVTLFAVPLFVKWLCDICRPVKTEHVV